jgi:hypothetical protein
MNCCRTFDLFKFVVLLAIVSIGIIYMYINVTSSLKERNQVLDRLKKEFELSERMAEFSYNQFLMLNGSKRPFRLTIEGPTSGGYGNKLYSLITSFLIAILSERAIIIRWDHIENFIQEPVYLAFKHFDYETIQRLDNSSSKVVYTPKALYPYKKFKDMDVLAKTKLPTEPAIVMYGLNEAYFFDICSNPIYFDKLLDYGLVGNETLARARDVTSNMSAFSNEQKMDRILMVGFEVGGNILKNFWNPKANLASEFIYFFTETNIIETYI